MKKIATFASAIAFAAALSTLLSSTAVAQTDNQESEAAELAGPDTKFVALALIAGLGEVQLSRLAAKNASSAEVKQFAEQVINDHSTLNKQFQALAKQHKIEEEGTKGTPPLEVSQEDKEMHDSLAKLMGEEFDRAYIEHMAEKHKVDISVYREEIEDGNAEEVKSLAEESLPLLEEHLRLAQALAASTQ